MVKLTKRERAFQLFRANLNLFQCPICTQGLSEGEGLSLNCKNGHNFDLARNGYLNLLMASQSEYYAKDLFIARRQVFEAGLFDPIVEQIKGFAERYVEEPLKVLDAGCGEGSLLVRMYRDNEQPNYLGIDISRDAIRLAGSYPDPIMWCVADLAQLPLRNQSVNLLLNMLSPANYGEFKRVLQPGGLVIKVVPGSRHLFEIRQFLGDEREHSNTEVLENFGDNFKVLERVQVDYQRTLGKDLWSAAIQMTPLTSKRLVQGCPAGELTVDLEVLCGIAAD